MIDIDIVLLLLKLAIVVLLYLFIFWVVRAAIGNVRGAAAAASPAPDVVLGEAPEPEYGPARAVAAGAAFTSDEPGRRPEPRLLVEESPMLAAGSDVRVARSLTIGRLSHNDIVLAEKVVSGEHARLVIDDGTLFVEDLGSTNGTFVDERQVTEAPLLPGSRLRIGHTVFRVEG